MTGRDYARAEVGALTRSLESETSLSSGAVAWLARFTLDVEHNIYDDMLFSASGARGEHANDGDEEEEEEAPAVKRARLALTHAAVAAAAAAGESSALELMPPEILQEILMYFSMEDHFLSLRSTSKLLRKQLGEQKIGRLEERVEISWDYGARVLCYWNNSLVVSSVNRRGVFWTFRELENGDFEKREFLDPDDLLILTAVPWRDLLATGSVIREPEETARVGVPITGIVRLWLMDGSIFRTIYLEDELHGVTDLIVWQDSLLVYTLLGTIFVFASPTTETPRVASVERPLSGAIAVVGDWVAAVVLPNRLVLWDPKTGASAAIITHTQAMKLVALDDRTLVLVTKESLQTLRFVNTSEDVVTAVQSAVLGQLRKPIGHGIYKATKLSRAIKWRHGLITLINYKRDPLMRHIRAPLTTSRLVVYNESLERVELHELQGDVSSGIAIKDGFAITYQGKIHIFTARVLPRKLLFPLE